MNVLPNLLYISIYFT